MGPAVAILLLGFLSVARVGSWEEAPHGKWSEAMAAHKGMKDVSSKPPLYRQPKAL